MPPVITTATPAASIVEANTHLRIIIYLLQFLLCLLYLHALPRASTIRHPDLPLRRKDVLELRPLPLTAAAITHQRRRRDNLIQLHNAIDAAEDTRNRYDGFNDNDHYDYDDIAEHNLCTYIDKCC